MKQKTAHLEMAIERLISNEQKNQIYINEQLSSFVQKLKQFKDDYRFYLEEQRKDDLRNRVELE